MSRRQVRTTRLLPSLLAGVLLAVGLAPATAAARSACSDVSPASLRIGTFSQSLTTLAADSEGFAAAQGLAVEYLQVTSSTGQFQDLRDGNYDLILTSPDNVVNYRLNESNALGGTFDPQIVAGANHGQNLSLVAQPGIESITDLRGKTLAVDSPSSGFAYIAYRMLREQGLERGSDYEVVPVGGTFQRYEAMLAGEVDAALLSGGFELRAEDAGFAILQAVQDVISPYMSSVLAGREAWLEGNCGAAVRLIRAYRNANRWVLDPANREDAIELLMGQPNMTRSLAERLYALQTTPGIGIIGDLEIDRKGLLANLDLRQEFDGFDEPQNLHYLASPASGLYDGSYRRLALRRSCGERVGAGR